MDVCMGCTTRAWMQQKLAQNKQVYSVRGLCPVPYAWQEGH
jgi:hypothetical protein